MPKKKFNRLMIIIYTVWWITTGILVATKVITDLSMPIISSIIMTAEFILIMSIINRRESK